MTRLETLCALHKKQGGTIHQYNRDYGLDFLNMSEEDFAQWVKDFKQGIVTRQGAAALSRIFG